MDSRLFSSPFDLLPLQLQALWAFCRDPLAETQNTETRARSQAREGAETSIETHFSVPILRGVPCYISHNSLLGAFFRHQRSRAAVPSSAMTTNRSPRMSLSRPAAYFAKLPARSCPVSAFLSICPVFVGQSLLDPQICSRGPSRISSWFAVAANTKRTVW